MRHSSRASAAVIWGLRKRSGACEESAAVETVPAAVPALEPAAA